MPSLAIDFGTSNCTAFIARKDAVVPVPLDGTDVVMPSAVFSPRSSDRAQQDQSFFTLLKDARTMLFGHPALEAYIEDPLGGVLVRSPKSFLGSDIAPEHMRAFEDVVVAMLRHIKARAEAVHGAKLDRVLLGRPVRYHGTRGEEGNTQAIDVMRRAAASAGFADIRFEFEPMAAAYEYESGIAAEQVVLVVDVGGGTTDIVMLRASPKRRNRAGREKDILGVAGDRIGGTDFDELLAWHAFMGEFGKDSKTSSGGLAPNSLIFDAISVRSVPSQLRFGSPTARREIDRMVRDSATPWKLERLRTVQEQQLQHRLVHSAELAKIDLTTAETADASLDYVEANLKVVVARPLFVEATGRLVRAIRELALETLAAAGTRPDVIFLTGGMASSPVIANAVADVAGRDVPLRFGDMLGSVGRGLALRAQRVFEQ